MIAVRLALRNVMRRGLGFVFIVFPVTCLFGVFTLLVCTESAMQQFMNAGLTSRAIRIGTVEGISTDRARWSEGEVSQVGARHRNAEMAPYTFIAARVGENKLRGIDLNLTNRPYIEIWDCNFHVEPDVLERWVQTRDGALVSRALADRYGWKVGDKITIEVDNDHINHYVPFPLTLVGISNSHLDLQVNVHPEYWREFFKRPVQWWAVWMVANKAEERASIMEQIDKELTDINRPHMMSTGETSRAAVLAASSILRTAFRLGGMFSFVLILTVSIALLTVSIDQRTSQLATLRAVGFRRWQLTAMIVAEGFFLLMPGAVLGALVVWIPLHSTPLVLDASFMVGCTTRIAILSAIGGTLLGVVAAIVPAWRVYHLDVLAGLR